MDAKCVVDVMQYFHHLNKLKEKDKKLLINSYLLQKHEHEAQRIQRMVTTNITDWLSVEDVDKVYISLNLDHHWVAIELNLKDGIISVYDSMKMTIHTRQTTTKLAPITHVLPNVLISLSRKEDCSIFTFKVIELLSTSLPLDVITPSKIPAFQLRIALDMLHRVYNV
ncbi:hypothetical protein D8674_026488 [Pyrus ussuriensis x Pyrus communis]|uniref:Ubiquitin-like protease family profile domain-containing protein n=1 Tax=Pyrus ussuriensis x Pyrus communis TaxID=2448454 RepID=A0A5N5ILK2_9ROSA|nr:hypothetical protein D8674_026488 [Pyrus ussuriensis x Pyrus communis]